MEEPMGGEEVIQGEAQASSAQEEKIFVSVRLRPSNEKEISRNDVSDWECINNTTIIFKSSLPERSMFPTAFTFDRVFGCDCATEKVYEEGAKEVALSVVSGINSSIFAYGQTSSGKTYTMSGVTEHAVADIYDYIKRHKERQFVLKFSAMEIYNEAVRDLLSSDSTPLRLLDDPERGTVVEKLTEETLRDWSHLQELLSICDAQRQIGETSLNETSSRSHQILRLTIESSAHEYLGAGNSSTLTATVNFVDLAGSERASQTLSAGVRLKEGCHINRSLLTLGTVIRKLSKGKNAHIPYRDSKLTRILQYSLGGNSRTAIICTMSPARSHVEQSRNTLLFASCAKEVTTNAQVNVVMSDKALVKQLQRELARLESEMRSVGSTPTSGHSAALLREKELLIEQMDKEIKELTHQRDLAQSRFENLLQSAGEDRVLRLDGYSAVEPSNVDNPLGLAVGLRTCNPCTDYDSPSVLNSNKHDLELSENPEDNFLLDDSTPKFAGLDICEGWEEIAQRTDGESEDICKEVRCIEMEETSVNRKIEADELSTGPEEKEGKLSMTRSMNEDAVSSPRMGDKEFSLICTSAPEGDKELSHICTSPQRGDKELSHICTSTPEGDKELSHISASPQKGDKELSHICTSTPEGDKELSHISASPQKGDKELSHICTSTPEGDKELSHISTSPQKRDKESIPNDTSHTYDALKRKIQEMQQTINYLVSFYPPEQSYCSSEADTSSCRSLNFTRSRSCRASVTNIPSPLWFEKSEQNGNTSPARFEKDFPGRPGGFYQNLSEIKYGANIDNFSRKDSQTSISSMEAQSIKELDVEDTPPAGSEKDFPGRPVGFDQKLSELKYGAHIRNLSRKDSQTSISSMEVQSIKESDVEDITNVCDFVVGLNEMAKLNPEKQSSENLVQEEACKTDEPGKDINGSGLETVLGAMQPHSNWPSEFERQQREIIELWVACKVPLVHRTYFFLLFKGDPSDSVYMEVELRRLSFLKDSFSRGTITMKDSQLVAPASSSKALNREREMLTKQIQKKFSRKEREGLYQKWGIGLNTKQRSVQLARRLWTDTTDMDHIKESAALVAKLVGFVDPGQAPKEIFGLSFLPRSINRRSYSWKS